MYLFQVHQNFSQFIAKQHKSPMCHPNHWEVEHPSRWYSVWSSWECGMNKLPLPPNMYKATLQGINISHLGKRKIIFKMPFLGDMLVSSPVVWYKDSMLDALCYACRFLWWKNESLILWSCLSSFLPCISTIPNPLTQSNPAQTQWIYSKSCYQPTSVKDDGKSSPSFTSAKMELTCSNFRMALANLRTAWVNPTVGVAQEHPPVHWIHGSMGELLVSGLIVPQLLN